MTAKLSALYHKYEDVILYIIFGVLTTIVAFVFQFIGKLALHLSVPMATVFSWIAAVTFAYVTNRIFVFKSKVTGIGKVTLEAVSFYAARLATLAIEIIIMTIFTDKLNHQVITFLHLDTIDYTSGLFSLVKNADDFNTLIFKILANVIVLITNYILSKMFIFKRKEQTT
ncbi:MAG: GtrA family protein [Oscillospiraceae bacterium]|nr:GtrA family protein [Oscillospiraceae bacterium]